MNISNGYYRRFSNSSIQEETDYNITPPDIEIWHGELPYKSGDKFPTASIKQRAAIYKTNLALYQNKLNGIMDKAFSWSDYMRDAITNMPNMAIVANLPDHYTCTEAWVDLIGAKAPRIDAAVGESEESFDVVSGKVKNASSIITNSNFAKHYQDVVRSAFMFGNKVSRVNKLDNGSVKVIDMPLKCWIPFMSEHDTSTVEANVFFNIYKSAGVSYCEFLVYLENGKIQKYVFEYKGRAGTGTLGMQVGEMEETEAFDGSGVSPIVIFYGDTVGNSPFGEEQFKNWDAAIAMSIRCYEALGVLLEKSKEFIKVMPEGATHTDEASGVTYNANTGSIVYAGGPENKPGVEIIGANNIKSAMDAALIAYKEALNRLSRDTGLPIAYFDPRELGSQISSKSLIASMFRSTLKAKKMSTNFERSTKQLISKMALSEGIELNMNDFNVIMSSGFIQDNEEQMRIIQARTGNAVTMTIADAIAEYDEISIGLATQKANKILGINTDVNSDIKINTSDSGDSSEVTGGLELTAVENKPEGEEEQAIFETPLGATLI